MVRVEQIDGRVAAINFNDFLTCWLIRDEKNILIEAGSPEGAHDLLGCLQELIVTPQRLDFLALTHIHIDHAGATGRLARANPDLKIFVHRAGVKHLLDPSTLMENVRKAYGGSAVAEILGVPSADMIVPVGSGDRIDLGQTALEVYETPGHARHHVVYFDGTSEAVFSGDSLGSLYRDHPNFVLAPPPDYDREIAKNSIDLIKGLHPKRINFAHCGSHTLEGDGFFEALKKKHDLWTESLLAFARERPGADYDWIFEQFLTRVPEVGDYPDQLYSYYLSVKGILLHLQKSGKIERHDL